MLDYVLSSFGSPAARFAVEDLEMGFDEFVTNEFKLFFR